MNQRLPIAILVAAGGAAGAGARWAVVTVADADGRFPWVTLLVNVVGCLLVGLLLHRPPQTKALLGVGMAGGLTTFSTFSLELAELLDSGGGGTAALYLATSLALGLLAILVGRRLSPC